LVIAFRDWLRSEAAAMNQPNRPVGRRRSGR
jgi:hypothetical protein